MLYKNDQRESSLGVDSPQHVHPLSQTLVVPEDKLEGAGRFYSHVTLPVGAKVPTHAHHGEYEIYDILSGTGTYNDNGTLVPVGPGDVTYCPDGESHGLDNTGDTPLEFVAFIGFANPAQKK